MVGLLDCWIVKWFRWLNGCWLVGWLDGWMVGWLVGWMVRLLDVWMVKFLIIWIGSRMIEYKIIKIADFFESIKVSGNITCIAILNTSFT